MEHNQNDGHNTIQQIQIQPNIGLDSDTRQSVVAILNTTLADGAVLAVKTRSAHWNVRGQIFSKYTLFLEFNTSYLITFPMRLPSVHACWVA
jgi:hypothetical protein